MNVHGSFHVLLFAAPCRLRARIFCFRVRLHCAHVCVCLLICLLLLLSYRHVLQLFQQVALGHRTQSLYLVTPHEQRSDALDFCTSSFTTQVCHSAHCHASAACTIALPIAHVYLASQLEMRFCLKKLLSKGNPSGPVKVRPHHPMRWLRCTRF